MRRRRVPHRALAHTWLRPTISVARPETAGRPASLAVRRRGQAPGATRSRRSRLARIVLDRPGSASGRCGEGASNTSTARGRSAVAGLVVHGDPRGDRRHGRAFARDIARLRLVRFAGLVWLSRAMRTERDRACPSPILCAVEQVGSPTDPLTASDVADLRRFLMPVADPRDARDCRYPALVLLCAAVSAC